MQSESFMMHYEFLHKLWEKHSMIILLHQFNIENNQISGQNVWIIVN